MSGALKSEAFDIQYSMYQGDKYVVLALLKLLGRWSLAMPLAWVGGGLLFYMADNVPTDTLIEIINGVTHLDYNTLRVVFADTYWFGFIFCAVFLVQFFNLVFVLLERRIGFIQNQFVVDIMSPVGHKILSRKVYDAEQVLSFSAGERSGVMAHFNSGPGRAFRSDNHHEYRGMAMVLNEHLATLKPPKEADVAQESYLQPTRKERVNRSTISVSDQGHTVWIDVLSIGHKERVIVLGGVLLSFLVTPTLLEVSHDIRALIIPAAGASFIVMQYGFFSGRLDTEVRGLRPPVVESFIGTLFSTYEIISSGGRVTVTQKLFNVIEREIFQGNKRDVKVIASERGVRLHFESRLAPLQLAHNMAPGQIEVLERYLND